MNISAALTPSVTPLRTRFRDAAALLTTGLFVSVIALGCTPEVSFDVPVEDTGVVQGSPLAGLLGALPGFGELTAFDLSDAQEFDNNNAAKENVTSCFLENATLTVTSPSGASLDFIDTMTFYIESPNNAREQAASADVPADATSIDFEIVDLDLSPYVRDSTMTISGEATGNAPSEDTTIKVELNFGVTATVDGNLLGAI